MKKFATIFMIVVIVLTAVFAAAMAPKAFASASCVYNPQHGWHIVGGSETEHWYETEQECLIALQVPTAMATLMATMIPTDTATEAPTEPPVVTETATEPPVVTETATEAPTEPPVVTETPMPTEPPVVTETPEPVPTAVNKRVNSCERNWEKIKDLVHKDEGYRYFEHHSWCKVWVFLRFGVNYDAYKALHP